MAWDPSVMTLEMRMGIPLTQSYLVHGEQGSMASTRVARAGRGLLEHSRALVALAPGEVIPDRPGAVVDSVRHRITECLSGMVSSFRPSIAMVSLVDVDLCATGFGQRARSRLRDQPLALLMGPRAVRDLKLDIAGLSKQFDVTKVGKARAPSAVLHLSGPDPLWNRFAAYAYDLDLERLAVALGQNRPGEGGFRVT